MEAAVTVLSSSLMDRWYYHYFILNAFQMVVNRHLHPQCPSSQYFHQLFTTHSILRSHIPWASTSLAYGCRRMFHISPDSSTCLSLRDIPLLGRRMEALTHGWKVVSQLCLLPEKKQQHWHLSSLDIAAVNALLVPNLPACKFLPSHALCSHSTI